MCFRSREEGGGVADVAGPSPRGEKTREGGAPVGIEGWLGVSISLALLLLRNKELRCECYDSDLLLHYDWFEIMSSLLLLLALMI